MTDKDGFLVLAPTCSRLYRRVNYLAPTPLVQNKIYEYDIRSANTSALRAAHKIKADTLDTLDQLPKHDREVYIGKMIAQDKSIRTAITDGIAQARMNLFIENGIQDDEVLSIKNDAVYIIGRRLRTIQFGYMEFVEKHRYSLYINLDKLELYYDRTAHTVDVKGIKDDVINHPDHQRGMIQFFATVMEHLVMDRRDALRQYLIQFSQDYKAKRLPMTFYRELNRENVYRTIMAIDDWNLNFDTANESYFDIINGIYNYMRYVLPFIQMYI